MIVFPWRALLLSLVCSGSLRAQAPRAEALDNSATLRIPPRVAQALSEQPDLRKLVTQPPNAVRKTFEVGSVLDDAELFAPEAEDRLRARLDALKAARDVAVCLRTTGPASYTRVTAECLPAVTVAGDATIVVVMTGAAGETSILVSSAAREALGGEEFLEAAMNYALRELEILGDPAERAEAFITQLAGSFESGEAPKLHRLWLGDGPGGSSRTTPIALDDDGSPGAGVTDGPVRAGAESPVANAAPPARRGWLSPWNVLMLGSGGFLALFLVVLAIRHRKLQKQWPADSMMEAQFSDTAPRADVERLPVRPRTLERPIRQPSADNADNVWRPASPHEIMAALGLARETVATLRQNPDAYSEDVLNYFLELFDWLENQLRTGTE